MRRVAIRLTLALAIGAGCGAVVGACGSGSVAEQARQSVAQGTATSGTGAATQEQTTREAASVADKTSTDPGKTTTTDQPTTTTVTKPAQTTTVTKATTETAPPKTTTQKVQGNTTQTVQSNKVVVSPTSTTPEGGSGGGVPWWGWVLIALGAVGIGAGIFWVGHRRGQRAKQGPERPPTSPQGGGYPSEPPDRRPPG